MAGFFFSWKRRVRSVGVIGVPRLDGCGRCPGADGAKFKLHGNGSRHNFNAKLVARKWPFCCPVANFPAPCLTGIMSPARLSLGSFGLAIIFPLFATLGCGLGHRPPAREPLADRDAGPVVGIAAFQGRPFPATGWAAALNHSRDMDMGHIRLVAAAFGRDRRVLAEALPRRADRRRKDGLASWERGRGSGRTSGGGPTAFSFAPNPVP